MLEDFGERPERRTWTQAETLICVTEVQRAMRSYQWRPAILLAFALVRQQSESSVEVAIVELVRCEAYDDCICVVRRHVHKVF